MNALNIWQGYHYAWIENRGHRQGEGDRPDDYAKRVRVNSLNTRREPGAKRDSTYCIVTVMNDDGTRKQDSYQRDLEPIEVRARDIVVLWDEYARERADRRNVVKAEEDARMSEFYARKAEEDAFKSWVVTRFDLPADVLTIDPYAGKIVIKLSWFKKLYEAEQVKPTVYVDPVVESQLRQLTLAPKATEPIEINDAGIKHDEPPVSPTWTYFMGGEDDDS